MPKLLTRDQFRERTFSRDRHCVFCDLPAVDAHHIIERKLWKDGGYYLENGASVCEEHHRACEYTDISVDEVRAACGIKQSVLPPNLNPDYTYDKWGNVVLESGNLLRGPLFDDAGVQFNLKHKLDLFTHIMKYPRTPHAPWSEGATSDDKRLANMDHFIGKDVVVTEKMDGENTTLYTDHMHARSMDGRSQEWQAWVRSFWATIRYDIFSGWRVCGENMYAAHSIFYEALESYFLGFSMWDNGNWCLAWDETAEYFDLLGVKPVPVLYRGVYNEAVIRSLFSEDKRDKMEGYVIRLAERFHYVHFQSSIAKVVRKNHVATDDHWTTKGITPNQLKKV